jgi:hypothetical protein
MNGIRGGRFSRAQTRNGHIKERVGSGGRPLRLDLGVIEQHTREVIYDLELGDAVRASHKVLHHKDVRQAFSDTGKAEYHKALDMWLKDIALGEVVSSGVMEQVFRHIRVGFTVAKIGFNLGTVLIQPTGLLQSAAQIGKMNMIKGMAQFIAHPARSYTDALEASDFMKERFGTFNKDMMDARQMLRSGIRIKGTQVVLPTRWIGTAGFYLIAKVQTLVDVATFWGSYQHGQKLFDGDHDKSVQYADSDGRACAGIRTIHR